MRHYLNLILIVTILSVLSVPAHAGMIIIGAESGGAASGTWETIADTPDVSSEYDNGSHWNERNLITAAQSAAGGPWTKVRVTFDSTTSHSDVTASVCIRSSADDCTATPTQITVSSSSGFTLNGATLSDEITFSCDTDDDLFVSLYVPDGISSNTSSTWDMYYRDSGSADDTMTQTVSFSGSPDAYDPMYTLVEGWNPD